MTSIIIKLSLESLMAGDKEIVINLDGSQTVTGSGDKNHNDGNRKRLFEFMEDIIRRLEAGRRERTAETYRATLSSFRQFREGKDIAFSELDSDVTESYERYLMEKDIALNTISFYMRILRAVYNKAVRQCLTADRQPFATVYTSIGRTVKRAVTIDVIRRIKDMEPRSKTGELARDMFLFSFYTRGMSFVDMAYLKPSDICDGIMVYRRKKTGRRIYVKWEENMQRIVDRYASESSVYLLPLIKKANGKERNQYRHKQDVINRELKAISDELQLDCRLSMYAARHSWASIARTLNVPVETICRGMGHDSERTTQIYLKTLNTDAIDQANMMIINALEE